jgi:hypothetical protein
LYQFFISDMVSSAVCSRFVSLPDPHDMHSDYLLQVLHFGPHTVIFMYLDTSMGMPASSIY